MPPTLLVPSDAIFDGMPMTDLSPSDRFHTALFGILAGVAILGHVLGATIFKNVLWGTHFYGFFPGVVLAAALIATLGLGLLWVRLPNGATAPAPPHSTAGRAAMWAGIVALSAGLFWWLRIRHTLLGDSGPLSHNLPLGEHTHPRQPLSLFLHHYVYEWARGLFEVSGRSLQDVARETVGLEGVVAGAIFVPVAFALARHLVAPAPASAVEGQRPGRGGVVALATALLLTQGYMQLFFGYVENYTWFTLAIGLYLWAGLSFVAGRAPLSLASLALAAAIGLNISGIAFLPSLAALGVWGLLRRDRRASTARDLGVTVLIFLGLQTFLASLGGFSAREGFRYMWDLVIRGEATDRSTNYLFSWPHLREFFAVQTLIGPFAGFLLVPAAAYRLAAPGAKDVRLFFLLMASLPPFAAAWLYGDSIQGIPRDWDLFAPFALPFVAAAVYCVASTPIHTAVLRRLLGIATLVSLFHTGSWVALNACEARSLERYKTLPASKGRTEMVVGYWYLTHGQKGLAREWFERAIAAYPANNLAHHQLGLYAMDEGRYADAVKHFEVAVSARPDKSNYRLSLVDALVLAGRPAEALPQLEALTAAEPSRAEFWGCYGIVLSGLGRVSEARAALERGAALAPGDPRYARLAARLGEPDAYARALREDWDALVIK
jgi:tetratricopeptide (TPR) repeat protein